MQAVDACGVEADDPVPERLAVHSCLSRRSLASCRRAYWPKPRAGRQSGRPPRTEPGAAAPRPICRPGPAMLPPSASSRHRHRAEGESRPSPNYQPGESKFRRFGITTVQPPSPGSFPRRYQCYTANGMIWVATRFICKLQLRPIPLASSVRIGTLAPPLPLPRTRSLSAMVPSRPSVRHSGAGAGPTGDGQPTSRRLDLASVARRRVCRSRE